MQSEWGLRLGRSQRPERPVKLAMPQERGILVVLKSVPECLAGHSIQSVAGGGKIGLGLGEGSENLVQEGTMREGEAEHRMADKGAQKDAEHLGDQNAD